MFVPIVSVKRGDGDGANMLTECVTRFFGKGLVHNVLRGCSIVLLDVVPDVHHGGHEGLGAALVVEYVVAAERHYSGRG